MSFVFMLVGALLGAWFCVDVFDENTGLTGALFGLLGGLLLNQLRTLRARVAALEQALARVGERAPAVAATAERAPAVAAPEPAPAPVARTDAPAATAAAEPASAPPLAAAAQAPARASDAAATPLALTPSTAIPAPPRVIPVHVEPARENAAVAGRNAGSPRATCRSRSARSSCSSASPR